MTRCALLGLLVLAGCRPVFPPPAKPAAYPSITAAVGGREELSEFRNLAARVGFLEDVEKLGPVTILAPNNLAFQAHQPPYLQKLTSDLPKLRHTLAGHVLPGRLTASDLRQRRRVHALIQKEPDGLSNDPIGSVDGDVMVADTRFVEPDIQAGSSVMHIVDNTLSPHFDPKRKANRTKPELWAVTASGG